MKKQTAVEWLIGQLPIFQQVALIELFNEAKLMEREQIINAYDSGTFFLEGEDYYKNTFEDESGI
jgi:hypothetical protein